MTHGDTTLREGAPILHRTVTLPAAFTTRVDHGGRELVYGGDIRIGDLTGDGRADFVVFRCAAGGVKPGFLAAFTMDGDPIWSSGAGGEQPVRPGPVVVHDTDGNGRAEIICLHAGDGPAAGPDSMVNAVLQVREGATGRVLRESAPAELTRRRGSGPNWVHQRILAANLRGGDRPRDFVLKLGDTVLAFTDELEMLWTYRIVWNDYGRCSAYIPAVGDIDGDGRDEVTGGYYLLDHDGTPLWERRIAPNMDSVAIVPWDNGRIRVVASGGGHVLDHRGDTVLALGETTVPHGQEVRVADFLGGRGRPEMIIRYNGHAPACLLVGNDGAVIHRFRLNDSPNQTGMEVVHWNGPGASALLYNGGTLWDLAARASTPLPALPPPVGPRRMGWYHALPADLTGDQREDLLVYNPWDHRVFLYTPAPWDESAYRGYAPGTRQINPRLMD